MKAVDVLGRADGLQDVGGADVRRQGQLHQDAVHRRVGVEPADQRQQIGLAGRFRQMVIDRHDAGGAGLPRLAFHIDLARRIGPHQHHGKARCDAGRGLQPAHLGPDLLTKGRRLRGAVDDVRGHDV